MGDGLPDGYAENRLDAAGELLLGSGESSHHSADARDYADADASQAREPRTDRKSRDLSGFCDAAGAMDWLSGRVSVCQRYGYEICTAAAAGGQLDSSGSA